MSGLGRAMSAAQAAYDDRQPAEFYEPDDPDIVTSLQPLDGASVLVDAQLYRGKLVVIVVVIGAYINGEFVDAAYFHPSTIARWHAAISKEYGA